MTVITTREMAAMRLVSDDFLPDTCSIWTLDSTDPVDAMGAPDLSAAQFTETYTFVPCRIDPTSGDEDLRGNDTPETVSRWMLNIPYTQAITVEDQVVHDSKTYEVEAVIDTQSYKTIRRAQLRRLS